MMIDYDLFLTVDMNASIKFEDSNLDMVCFFIVAHCQPRRH